MYTVYKQVLVLGGLLSIPVYLYTHYFLYGCTSVRLHHSARVRVLVFVFVFSVPLLLSILFLYSSSCMGNISHDAIIVANRLQYKFERVHCLESMHIGIHSVLVLHECYIVLERHSATATFALLTVIYPDNITVSLIPARTICTSTVQVQ